MLQSQLTTVSYGFLVAVHFIHICAFLLCFVICCTYSRRHHTDRVDNRLAAILQEDFSGPLLEDRRASYHHPHKRTEVKQRDIEVQQRGGYLSPMDSNESSMRSSDTIEELYGYCDTLCNWCSSVLSIRWTALCIPNCHELNGRSYEGCRMLYEATFKVDGKRI